MVVHGGLTHVYNQNYNNGVFAEIERQPLLFISAAPDKSRVHSIGMNNTIFAMPGNLAWWGAPQDTVDACYKRESAVAVGVCY